jgi:hypothetical protein
MKWSLNLLRFNEKSLFAAVNIFNNSMSRYSSDGIAAGYGLDKQGGGGGSSNPGRVKIFISPYRPDLLWGPPNQI